MRWLGEKQIEGRDVMWGENIVSPSGDVKNFVMERKCLINFIRVNKDDKNLSF